MLSGAKHLQYLLEYKQIQILRAVYPERSERAQDDSQTRSTAACLAEIRGRLHIGDAHSCTMDIRV
jgi:hypothetical protein